MHLVGLDIKSAVCKYQHANTYAREQNNLIRESAALNSNFNVVSIFLKL